MSHQEYWLHYIIDMQQKRIFQLESFLKNLQLAVTDMYSYCLKLQEYTQRFHTVNQINKTLDWLPVTCFVLDESGYARYCNRIQANNMLSDDPNEFMNRHLHDIAKAYRWAPEMSDKLLRNNRLVLTSNKLQILKESMLVEGVERFYNSYKQPTYLYDNNPVVLGIAFDITDQKQLEQELQQEQQAMWLAQKLQSGADLKVLIDALNLIEPTVTIDQRRVVLTKKQTTCVLYLLQHGTSKKIARAMSISHRTVEEHISILRDKLNCENKTELIVKLLNGRLLNSLADQCQGFLTVDSAQTKN